MTDRDINGHGGEQPPIACATIQSLLPAYVTAEALGQHRHTIYHHVAAHLLTCASCRAAFDELRELTIDAYAGAVEPASSYPQADLSFLPAQPAAVSASQPWRINEWGRLVIQFSQALLDSLRPPALLAAARGQMLYSYRVQPRDLPDFDVTIEVLAENTQPGLGFVRVNVEALDRDPLDQAPVEVVLRSDGIAREAITDETGCVAFDSVPLAMLPYLTIEIATDRA